ncbi:MAG: hypothetical protein JEZ14_09120 [Marinilabiliaceae bacterium]|nr:hypothetical protein [Marinilabiliaceae bacterium]
MNKITRNIKKNAPLFFIALGALLISITSCKKTEYVSPQEYLDKENELLVKYYDELVNIGEDGNPINDSTRLEVMTAEAIDTVDHRLESGMMLFHTKQGTGDLISANKRVGYRYSIYQISEIEGVTGEEYLGSNIYDASPEIFSTLPLIYSTSDLQRQLGSNIPVGVNEAVQYMRLGGKCKIILPSTINGTGRYLSILMELEITYIDQN